MGKILTPPCFFPCAAFELKARVSLNRIEEFLGRVDIEGQPADKDFAGSGGTADHPRAPVGGLLVQNGTFTWPQTVSRFQTDRGVLLPGAAILRCCSQAAGVRSGIRKPRKPTRRVQDILDHLRCCYFIRKAKSTEWSVPGLKCTQQGEPSSLRPYLLE